MTLTTEDYGACGGVSLILALLPTIGLIISELMPYIHKKDKCNGLLQTLICGIKHIVNKEPCNSEEIVDVINLIKEEKIEEP